MKHRCLYLISSIVLLTSQLNVYAQMQANLSKQWPEITVDAKPWTRWWWMGNAVDSADIRILMSDYADHGFGGVEITPIYGVQGEESKNIGFLSPVWIDMLGITVAEAGKNGMKVDMNTGTGWPFGGPQVTDKIAAKRMRFVELGDVSQNQINQFILECENSTDSDLIALSAFNDFGQRINLLDKGLSINQIQETGRKVTAVTQSNTGQMVKRAAPGGEGLVFNHFSKDATENYLARFDKAFNGNPGVRCFFNDSYELENASGSSGLFESFKKIKGYDLALYTRELSGKGNPDTISRIKADYRDVLGEMLLENFTKTWTKWANKHGAITRNQAHGSPSNIIDLYAAVGIPEVETFNANNFPFLSSFFSRSGAKLTESNRLFKKFASSAAHQKGESLVSCETFTWLNEHFNTPLYQCKPELDELFVKGVNHVFFHGTCYSPESASWPGWGFYASVHMDPGNPQWEDVKAMNDYIARCQSVLQQGQQTNDFLVLWSPEDYFSMSSGLEKKLTLHNSEEWVNMPEIDSLLDRGFLFDFTTDRIIGESEVQDSQILTFGKTAYGAVVVPRIKHIKFETFQKLLALAKQGATVIFIEMPETVSGLLDYQREEDEMKSSMQNIPFSTEGELQCAKYGKGIIYIGNPEIALEKAGVEREKLIDHKIKFISKKVDNDYYYFLANHESSEVCDWLPFKHFASHAVLMDPMSGVVGLLDSKDGLVKVSLKPGESGIIRFTDKPVTGMEKREFVTRRILKLKGAWKLGALKGGPFLFETKELPHLMYWTDLKGEQYESFAGTATYQTTFNLDKKVGDEYLMKFDSVEASVRVFINGHEAGTIWSFPFEIRIGKYLQAGENDITLEVSNLGANRIRYMDKNHIVWKKFENINVVNQNYKPLDASNWSVIPGGLSGDVMIEEQAIR